MNAALRKTAKEAYAQFKELLEAAEKGRATIITKHGRPVAALMPIQEPAIRQQPLLSLAGAGRGLWGKDSTRILRRLRNEWNE